MPFHVPSRIEIHSDVVEVVAGDLIRGNELWFLHHAEVRDHLEKMDHPALVVNMREVQMINSIGITALLRYYRAVLDVGGQFGLISTGAMIQGVFEMLGLKRKFTLYRDMDTFRRKALGWVPPPEGEPESAAPEGQAEAPAPAEQPAAPRAEPPGDAPAG